MRAALGQGVGPHQVVPPPSLPDEPPAASTEAARPSLAQQRDALLARKNEIMRLHGRATLRGEPLKFRDELRELEAALLAIESAGELQHEDARKAAAQAAKSRHDRLVADDVVLAAAVDQQMEAAEQAANVLVEAFARVRHLTQQRIALFQAANLPVPASLVRMAQDQRFGFMLSSALSPIRSGVNALGYVRWTNPPTASVGPPCIEDWCKYERNATRDVETTLKRGSPL